MINYYFWGIMKHDRSQYKSYMKICLIIVLFYHVISESLSENAEWSLVRRPSPAPLKQREGKKTETIDLKIRSQTCYWWWKHEPQLRADTGCYHRSIKAAEAVSPDVDAGVGTAYC